MTINFGTFLLMQSPSARSSQEIYARGLEIAQAAETLGFDNVWLAEHHFSTYGYLSRPAQLATYIAARTTRIRVGTAVIVVPLHHPLVIAEEIATLDLLAGGRVDVGLGRGYQPYEFERLGLDLESGWARWDEAIDIILKAFTGQPSSYDGKLFKIPGTFVFPQPLQQPHPPIWITAQSPESVEAPCAAASTCSRAASACPSSGWASSAGSSIVSSPRTSLCIRSGSACSARSTWRRARPTPARPSRRPAGTCG